MIDYFTIILSCVINSKVKPCFVIIKVKASKSVVKLEEVIGVSDLKFIVVIIVSNQMDLSVN